MKGLKYILLSLLLSFACVACACDSSDSPMPSNSSQGTEEGVENGGEEESGSTENEGEQDSGEEDEYAPNF